jgi:hypothetical protein
MSSSQYTRHARRRSPEEVISDHLLKLQAGDVDEDVSRNYADDAVVLSGAGVHRGHAGARRAAKTLLKSLAGARLEVRRRVVYGEYAFVEWVGVGEEQQEVLEGAESFVVRDGRIAAHTSHVMAQPHQH